MVYLLNVRLANNKKHTFRIEGKNEAEVRRKLPNRLPPQERDDYCIDSVEIDPKSLGDEEPYGVFLHE